MCGICGILGDGAGKKINEVKSMMDVLIHRGPDGEGIYSDHQVCFGHRRLKIIDLTENARQPMTNEDESIILVYNGEIYNYLELKKQLKKKGYKFKSSSDTEVLIHAYEEWGKDCLAKFNGMFVFALYDKNRNIVFIARDRFGIKPLYWIKKNGFFYFASEIKALLQINDIIASVNDDMVFDYLVFARVDHTENTFFNDIYRLKPGNFILYKDGGSRINQWWKLVENKGKKGDFLKYLDDSVELRLRSDVPLGSSLSGGLDSSSIVTILQKKLNNNQIHSFSAVYDEKWEKNENKYIDLLIKHLGLSAKKVTPTLKMFLNDIDQFIYHQEEPFGSIGIYAAWKVIELARKNNITVLLNGQGGDEILAGYPYFTTYYLRELIRDRRIYRFIKEALLYIKRERDFYALKLLVFLGLSQKLKRKALITKIPVINQDFFNETIGKSRVIKEFLDARDLNDAIVKHLEYKLEHLLRYEDRNSMAFSVESRLPFLDFRLVEYMISQPAEIKIKDGIQKIALRESMIKLLPDQIRLREDKVGFEIPENEWLQNNGLKKFFKKYVNRKMRTIKYYQPEKLEKIVTNYLSGQEGNERLLWRILNLELWYRKFIDRQPNTFVIPKK